MSNKEGISAYDLDKRVKTYDADMDLMHPNRSKMVEIAIEFFPFNPVDNLKVVDLGIGTGFFSLKFLNKYPNSRIIGIDGARTMIELSKTRLNKFSNNIKFRLGDFRDIRKILSDIGDIDIVFSSYALHHLDMEEKRKLFIFLQELLKKDGWFINADLIIAESQAIEDRFQEVRVDGIIFRAKGKDPRFKDSNSTSKFLSDLETNEKDQPIPLSKDLCLLYDSGFKNVEILWKEYREVLLCAQNK